jgi:hypothetical protein
MNMCVWCICGVPVVFGDVMLKIIWVYALLSIAIFEMQGISKKQQKNEKKQGPLPCVCTRQRTFGHFAVCTCTAKEPRVAKLCSWELTGCGCRRLGRAGRGAGARQRSMHGTEKRTAKTCGHGKVLAHGKVRAHGIEHDARQSLGARHRTRRTA